MSIATFQVNIAPKRLLSRTDAASHCGRPARRFDIECPVSPIEFDNGDRRWDVRELDAWIDSLKQDESNSELLARLDG